MYPRAHLGAAPGVSSCLARRLVAFLIDVVLAYAVYFAVGAPEPVGVDPAPALLAITWVLRAVPELIWRRSPGKMLVRIDVVGPRWAPLIRHLWLVLPIPLGMAALMVPWYSLFAVAVGVSAYATKDNRSLADRASRSTVLQRGVGCSLPS